MQSLILGILTFVALVETVFFSLIYLGWSSYVYVLIDRGFYLHLCFYGNYSQAVMTTTLGTGPRVNSSGNSSAIFDSHMVKDDSLSCNKQQESLNLIYSVSVAVISAVVIFWGFFTYRYGNVRSKILSMIAFTSGLLTLGFASPEFPWIIAVGLILVGFGGLATVILNMKVAFSLPFGVGIYIALLNGAADSSVLTLRIVKLLYENGVENKYALIGIAVLYVIIGSFSAVLHHVHETSKTKDQELQSNNNIKDKKGSTGNETTEDDTPKHKVKDSLCWPLTLTHLIWFSLLYTIFIMYIGIINARLVQHFPGEVSYFTNIMANIMIGGMLTSFIPGALAEWEKTMFFQENRSTRDTRLLQQIPNLCISSLLAVLLSVLSFNVSRATFYAEFVVLTMFRSFLFSTNMNVIVSVYPSKHTNVIYPLTQSIGGLVTTTGYGFFRWYNLSVESQTQVQICLSLLAVFTLIHPLYVFVIKKCRPLDVKLPSSVLKIVPENELIQMKI